MLWQFNKFKTNPEHTQIKILQNAKFFFFFPRKPKTKLYRPSPDIDT